ncbi:hypothetical protein LPW26_05995 [Rhodopseudomonas sp. HC1]|uniref:hypothetical protein n=1 Tax=Rhodopseudomonas infernalis TaxID=2897386 RepID=UPI001EE8DE8A|nr:hypothetical protein [Rhodopseudomonas infernalis]MCG6204178.1 hypothetical protein [Rhodopseudomonas infernalis]
MTPGRIIDLLQRYRLPLSDEKRLQEDMLGVLTGDGLIARREVHLGDGDIVDFFVISHDILPLRGLAIEVKIKGSRRAIYRQLERYCAHDEVEQIILATNVAMTLPATIGGKPAFVANLGRAWL